MGSGGKEQRKGNRSGNHGHFLLSILALLAFFWAPMQSTASELKKQTAAVWDEYVNSTCLRAEARAKEPPFLRIDDLPERHLRLQAGETLIWRGAPAQATPVPHGLIHDWVGAVFIPKATMADVLAVTRDYNHYAEIYRPVVIGARQLDSDGDNDRFSMLLVQKVAFVTAALSGEYETQYVQVDAKRWYSISKSIRLQAVEDYGQPAMQVLPPDRGPGYVWRLYSFTRFEESDGGVYIELEAVALSRDVPRLLRWLADPIVDHLPRNALRETLEETRKAVLARLSRED